MKKIISLGVLLTMMGALTLLTSSADARTEECGRDRVTRYRVGRETIIIPAEPCSDETDEDQTEPPTIPETDLRVVLQDDALVTHVEPGTESVILASAILDASNSDKEVRTTSIEFDIIMTSFADYSNVTNCGLYHEGSFVQPTAVAKATVTAAGDDLTISLSEFVYSLPASSLVTPRNEEISVDLVCDFPPELTEARVTTRVSADNFAASNSDGRSVDYSIIPHAGRTIDVYSGDPPVWVIDVPVEDPGPGDDGDAGDTGNNGEDGDTDGDDAEDDDQDSRRERTDKPDKR